MRTLIYIILLTCSGILSAQVSHDSIFGKVAENYSQGKPIMFEAKYSLFKSYTTQTVYESYNGQYFRNEKNETYIKINYTEYFLSARLSAQVNTEEKIILVMNSASLKKNELDISHLITLFNKGAIKDMKTYWEVELIGKQVSSLPYSRIVIHISKDYYVQKQIYYYSSGINFSEDFSKPDIQAPRLEITSGKPKRDVIPASTFDFSKYFTVEGKSLKLSPTSKDYELIDQR